MNENETFEEAIAGERDQIARAKAERCSRRGRCGMSANEIRRLAKRSKEIAELPDDKLCVSTWDEEHHYQVEKPTKEVRSALLAFAAMVERCEEVRKKVEGRAAQYPIEYNMVMPDLDFIEKGATDGRK